MITNCEDFSVTGLETAFKAWVAANGFKIGDVMPLLRVALAGTMQGPPVFEMIHLLGKNKSAERLKKSLSYFETV